jgi:argininosuccinate lyase
MLWGGRFAYTVDQRTRRFSDSISFDRRLWEVDISASIAYAKALVRAHLLTPLEGEQLIAGLSQVRAEFDGSVFSFAPGDEDIHTAVERRLGECIGPLAGKLHTGRSRNDQVSTDLRLYVRGEADSLAESLALLQWAIVRKAEQHLDVIMPGYTHLQQAQPLLFSHWLMSFFWKFRRDQTRLRDVIERASVMPLGAGAIAGTPFEIDRQFLADELGFSAVSANSVDAVSDRDYVVEFLCWSALLQVHISGLAEDLVLWSSREFGFVEIDERYSTGSSLMPQKRNPDPLELMRAKTGRMVGHQVSLLMVLKGLPSGYNKDLQEDKEALFNAVDTLKLELPIAADVIGTLQVRPDRMAEALDEAVLATDLADYLVRKGVPFRQCHQLVGQAIRRAERLGIPLSRLPIEEYHRISLQFENDLYEVFDFGASIARRQTEGGTAPASVLQQIEHAKALLGG